MYVCLYLIADLCLDSQAQAMYGLPVGLVSRGRGLLSESGHQRERACNYVSVKQLGGRGRMLLVCRGCPALRTI